MVAIVGSAAGAHVVDPSPGMDATAEAVGRAVVDAGYRIATGGRSGVMEAASRGARSATAYREGDVIGILPGLDADEANAFVDIAIPTGLNHARNVVLVSMADAVVAVGGGAGTLSEIALAWTSNKPVIALSGHGWADRLGGERLDERRDDSIRRARNVAEVMVALEQIFSE